ncbi:MAG: T9SS type A sorting domain-containing protein [Dysgonamonadaceae bacterium]|jgi:hypothetical protein|nr:T9SS type A sorting domain-containing protein [Dysgonamonadaceae bacterium]
MKRIFFVFILYGLTFAVNAQTVYLYTPKGSQVYAFQRAEMSASDISYYTLQYRNAYPQATVLANATNTYNCHSYAWNIKEGGVTCWLNQSPDLHKYWDDGSYIETTENQAEKIFYYNGDHSAVKSSVSGKYESKWGAMPLMRHSPEYGPSGYNMPYRRYYRRNPPVISGASSVCFNNNATFTVHNPPAGYIWISSSNLTKVSTSGNTATFKAKGSSSQGWVAIKAGGTEIAKFNTALNVCQPPEHSDFIAVAGTFSNEYWAEATCLSNAIDCYEWITVGSGWSITQHPMSMSDMPYMYKIRITQSPPSYDAILKVRAHNSAGWSEEWTPAAYISYNGSLIGTSYRSLSASPNPVSDILNIEFAAVETVSQTHEAALAEPVEIQSDQSAVPLKTRVLQTETSATKAEVLQKREAKLYNQSGSQVRSMTFTGDKTQLNVSDLPAGIYYLHIYDGVNDKPEIRQIIVQH